MTTEPVSEGVWRELVPHTLARLLRQYGSQNFDLCEDAVQDALLEAHTTWAEHPPTDPHAWMVTVARRRYVDRIRSEHRRRQREEREYELSQPLDTETAAENRDDSLHLLVLCCHPDLPRSGQIALTLRAVAGLSTRQIANAYLLPEATIAQRIVRAKRRLAGLSIATPSDYAQRLESVRTVLYLMLTEAHHTTDGELVSNPPLMNESIRLTRMLTRAVPEDSETAGLLALMLLTAARSPARLDGDGGLVPIDRQDRRLWDPDLTSEALQLLDRTVPGAEPGYYLAQACVAATHMRATTAEDTDWREILALYRLLDLHSGGLNPAIALNRIIAEAMVHGSDTGLHLLNILTTQHPRLPRAHAVRAQLLLRSGNPEAAREAFQSAVEQTHSTAEATYLRKELRRLGTS